MSLQCARAQGLCRRCESVCQVASAAAVRGCRLPRTVPQCPPQVVRSRLMCKRLVIPEQEDAEKELSVMHPWWRFSVRFNVAVTQRVPVARLHDLETEGVMMRWGFVPAPEEGN